MLTNIKLATEAILAFIKSLSVSTATVNSYRSYFKRIIELCKKNNIAEFCAGNAERFIKLQVKRHQKGEISFPYMSSLRKSALTLSDYFEGREFVWERRCFHKKQRICEEYEKILLEFGEHTASSFSYGHVGRVVTLV